jgi:hypothetical protein
MIHTEFVQTDASSRNVAKETRFDHRPVRNANLAVVAWVTMFCSILIFRASDLETSGLGNKDNYYRIILVLFSAAASVSILLVNTNRLRQYISGPLVFLEMYGLYAMITGLFVPAYALYAMWKGFEIAVDVLVVMALLSYKQAHANVFTAYRTIVSAFTILIGIWWVEALIWPTVAFVPTKGLLGFELQGISPVYNPNTVGFAAALVALAAFCRLFYDSRGFRKIVTCVVLALAIVTLIASQSRTGIGGLVLAVCAYLFFGKRHLMLFLALTVTTILFLATSFGDVAEEYLVRGQTVGSLSTLSGRTAAWEKAWDAFLLSPYFGNGFVAYTRSEIFGIGGSSHLHNAVLEALVGTGAIGTFFWLGAVLWMGVLALRLRQVKLVCPGNSRQMISGDEMIGVFVLVMARAFTSSGPAFHDHSFMVLLAVAAFVSANAKQKALFAPPKRQVSSQLTH